jgi:ACS family D-galactonate transporter-like MFS transporter
VLAAFWLLADDGPPRDTAGGGRVATGWVWRTRAWWLLGLIQFARLSIVAGFGFWIPAFLIEERGFSIAAAGIVVAVSSAITAPSNIGGGILSDRLGRPLVVIGGALAAMVVVLALIGVVTASPALIALICVNALVIQLYFGPLFAVPRHLFGPGLAGLSSGFGNFCANLGGFASALLLGVIKDATGSFGLGFLTLSGVALVGLLAVVWLSRSVPRRPQPVE